jgi:glycosyltransferase involved in cell wall biosynthesis
VFASYFEHFDAVFCPGIHHFTDWAALKARASLGRPLPIVMTIEGLLGVAGDDVFDRRYSEVAGHPTFSQKVPRPLWRRVSDLYEMADHIVAISPFLARQATAQYGAKVSMLGLGVDTALFRRGRWERRPRPRVVCAANVRAHKQPHVFLDLAARFPGADFVWFGDGELRAPLLEQAMQAGIGNLHFPGAIASAVLACEFAASDIMVLPSRNEGVPKVTQEAAAAGLAQIVFGFYEAPSVVDGINGFVVSSEEEMAAKLALLLDDPDLAERFGRAGADMAQAWSWDLIAPQWQQRISEAVERATVARAKVGERRWAQSP